MPLWTPANHIVKFRSPEPWNIAKDSPSRGVLKVALRPGKVSTLDRSIIRNFGRFILLSLGIFSLKKRRFCESFAFGRKRGARLLKLLVICLSDLLVLVPALLDFFTSFRTLSDMGLRVNLPLLKLLVRLADVLLLNEGLVLDFYSHPSVTLPIRGFLLFLCSKRQTSRSLFGLLRSR